MHYASIIQKLQRELDQVSSFPALGLYILDEEVDKYSKEIWVTPLANMTNLLNSSGEQWGFVLTDIPLSNEAKRLC